MNRLKSGMTPWKLLRNTIHNKTRVITFVAVLCLKQFSNEATALFALQKVQIIRIRITQSLCRIFYFNELVVISY